MRIFCALCIALFLITSATAAIVSDLRCDNAANPIGIDDIQPRLSWTLASAKRGVMQTAFQVLVASSPDILAKNTGDLWDSGHVASDQSVNNVYGGKRLTSRTRCYWKVRTWDNQAEASGWSVPAAWSMGLLKPTDWSARWIGRDDDATSAFAGARWIWYPEGDPTQSAPIATRYFRRTITVPAGQTVTRATCDIAADNSYALTINSRKAGSGDVWMQPGSLTIASLLHAGANVVKIRATNTGDTPNPAGVIAHLHLQFASGQPPLDVVTDGQWESSVDGVTWTASKPLAAFGGGPWSPDAMNHGPLPARYLRREIPIAKRIAHATAYVCGLGFFDLFINGTKISDDIMDPALSDYTKSDYYVTFDVTKQMHPGTNAIGVILGNGRFYAPRVSVPIATTSFGFPKLLTQIEIEYADGTKATVVSDESWRMTTAGPIRANNEYDGEEYDAHLEMPGWNRPGFAAAHWEAAKAVAAPTGLLHAQMIEPMRVTQVMHPISVTKSGPGSWLVDMGQNFYGTVRMTASGPRGVQVRLVSAYAANADGTLKTADNRSALSTDVYTFKGNGVETWNPRFRGQGYRRVQVTGFPGTPTTANFEGLVIHTDVRPVGEFACSNSLINRIHSALNRGAKSFLRSAPLDPDRDERQAWTGDPAKDAESEAYNFDVSRFYTKWMDDLQVSERADGSIPDVAMYWTMGAGVEWPSVFTIIPDWFSDFYGDRRLGQSHYAAMKTWVLAMQRYRQPDGTLPPTSYGDWCDTATIGGKVSDNGATPRDLISTAYQYNNCRIVERLAKQGGRADDERTFADLADKLKAAFNRKFFDPKRQVYLGETQCGYVLALKFGLVPEASRDAVVAHLVDDVMVKHSGHLTVGLVGMQWLMQTLTDVGRPDVAWTIATQTTRPGWGYMLSKGATTIWERWDYDTRDPGMNSEDLLIQAGNLDAWFYQTLAGINDDPNHGGFKHIRITPHVLGDLTWVRAHFDSPYGRIVSGWKRTGKRFTLDVTIPANATATVVVLGKGGGPHEVGSGEYRFVSELD